MNTFFLNIVKHDVLNFVANATEQDCEFIVEKFYQKGFFEFIKRLRESTVAEKESTPISFISQFPDQAVKLPALSFVLGNIQMDMPLQTYSYETSELTNEEYKKYRHLASTFIGSQQAYVNTKSFIHTSQIVIGCYSQNKTEVSWLLYLVDYILKFRMEHINALGLIDLSISQTDLRLQQELFPLAVPTRILTVNFKYEKIFPRPDESSHLFAEIATLLSEEESTNTLTI